MVVPADSGEEAMKQAAFADRKIAGYMEGMDVVKVITVKDKLVNIILKPKK